MRNLDDVTHAVFSRKIESLEARINQLETLLAGPPVSPSPGVPCWIPTWQAALRLGVKVKTLGERRRKGQIPKWVYSQENSRSYTYLESWVEAQRVLMMTGKKHNIFKR